MARKLRPRKTACDDCLCIKCKKRKSCNNCKTCIYLTLDLRDEDKLVLECKNFDPSRAVRG